MQPFQHTIIPIGPEIPDPAQLDLFDYGFAKLALEPAVQESNPRIDLVTRSPTPQLLSNGQNSGASVLYEKSRALVLKFFNNQKINEERNQRDQSEVG